VIAIPDHGDLGSAIKTPRFHRHRLFSTSPSLPAFTRRCRAQVCGSCEFILARAGRWANPRGRISVRTYPAQCHKSADSVQGTIQFSLWPYSGRGRGCPMFGLGAQPPTPFLGARMLPDVRKPWFRHRAALWRWARLCRLFLTVAGLNLDGRTGSRCTGTRLRRVTRKMTCWSITNLVAERFHRFDILH